ncbi:hypothetical protein OTB20_21885 [Streptomyces sp. H27-H1]|uniref:hypothetical protein n=1 Tax=Streptomyces sp. H27-H1 TaxID=2996461 RepID=UPI00227005C3|nr:hypothetical protein [Streptomyces sp. H27-H1]MCY0928811.1 hypothetical protein [Streptomyces sp. H27-H1]
MNASVSERLGLGILGALLAGGLLLAACAAPEAQAEGPGEVVFHHPGVVFSHTRDRGVAVTYTRFQRDRGPASTNGRTRSPRTPTPCCGR